jgi:antitoxin ParD1/3/4
MGTMNISLPDALRSFVDERVAEGGYGSTSEYVRELIRREVDRTRVRNLLLEGASSAPAVTADERYFQGLRQRIRHSSSG